MKNSNFNIEIDSETGYIGSIVILQDEHRMNWCGDVGRWGKIITPYHRDTTEHHEYITKKEEPVLKSFRADDESCEAVYENKKISVKITRGFTPVGNFFEKMVIRNIADSVISITRDNFAIQLPLSDRYTYADDCMTNHCNTHIWCGKNTSWINALKMGASDINLGLVLTEGSFVSYSQQGCRGNLRGCFELEPESRLLKVGEEYAFSWELFVHSGKKDFLQKLAAYSSYIGVRAKHFTVFEGENIEFEIQVSNGTVPKVYCKGEQIPVKEENGSFFVSYTPSTTGEYKFDITCGEVSTYAEFNCKIPFAKLTEKRVHFIVDNQQCLDKESPLYGAYLVYDNKLQSQYFDFYITDQNACRERLNMSFTLIRYLQLKNDPKVRKSLDLFIDFMFREFYEEKTGEVFNNVGKTRDALRLYNAPGVMLLFSEMYYLTRDEKYIDNIEMLAKKYYSIGGEKCYSNALAIRKVLGAIKLAGRNEELMKDFFRMHTDNMIKNGVSYPKHEVNYEQTIVTPAVTCISEMGLYSENKEHYLEKVQMHLECLDRFVGNQPSFHLNEISIRYWDDYWFGKAMVHGDTLPHHLSCLTARSFVAYARLSGDKTYIDRAEECIRNCLCLISDEARGSASYVYPHIVNGQNGEFYDEWANDQDLTLYDGMNFCDLIKTFEIM